MLDKVSVGKPRFGLKINKCAGKYKEMLQLPVNKKVETLITRRAQCKKVLVPNSHLKVVLINSCH